MSSTFEVRIATEADVALLAAVGQATFRDTFGAENTAADMEAYVAGAFSEERIAGELSAPSSTFYIATASGDVAGYARLHASRAPAVLVGRTPIELVRLYAVAHWIGLGAGRALLGRCIENARLGGYDSMWLGVWERNDRALGFYSRAGFIERGDKTFVLGADVQRDLIMELMFAPDAG